MKNEQKLRILILSIFILFLFIDLIFAQNSGVPFLSKLTGKLTMITKELSSTTARVVFTLVIIIFGYMTFSGRINKAFGITIVGAVLIISFAEEIATWFLSKN